MHLSNSTYNLAWSVPVERHDIAHSQSTGARTGRRESFKQLPSLKDVSGMNFFDGPGAHRLWQICLWNLLIPPGSCKLTPSGNHLALTALR
jgi:hypothetical protein